MRTWASSCIFRETGSLAGVKLRARFEHVEWPQGEADPVRMKTNIGVNGACGRMSQRIIQLAHEDKSLHLAAALESAGHPALGKDVGDLAGVGPAGRPGRLRPARRSAP